MLRVLGLTEVSTGDVLFNDRGLPGAGAVSNVNTCWRVGTGNLGKVIVSTGGDGTFEGNLTGILGTVSNTTVSIYIFTIKGAQRDTREVFFYFYSF